MKKCRCIKPIHRGSPQEIRIGDIVDYMEAEANMYIRHSGYIILIKYRFFVNQDSFNKHFIDLQEQRNKNLNQILC